VTRLTLWAAALIGAASCTAADAPEEWTGEGALVIEGATVFTSPRTPAIYDGAVLVVDGIIEAVGEVGSFLVPPSAARIDGVGLSVLAGFWNSQTRMEEDILVAARVGSAAELQGLVRERYTRFGFTSIVDTGTPWDELSVLVDRIQSGEVMGPRIVSALDDGTARVWLPSADQPIWPAELAGGFVAEDVAAVAGLGFLRAGGASPVAVDEALGMVRAFVGTGGRLVFGTGAGYVDAYDPLPDHFLLSDAGIAFDVRLASLTTEPALRFGYAYAGEIAPGMVADLVLLEGDPEVDVTAFGRVQMVLREARGLFP
jgi:hypothetical protein